MSTPYRRIIISSTRITYHLDSYLSPDFNQLFRNQLLTHIAVDNNQALTDCALAVLYSISDRKCVKSINNFNKMLLRPEAFVPITIESLVKTIIDYSEDQEELKRLYLAIHERYCNYDLVESFL